MNIPYFIIFFILITCLLVIVWILQGEIQCWSLMGVKELIYPAFFLEIFRVDTISIFTINQASVMPLSSLNFFFTRILCWFLNLPPSIIK